MIGEYLLGCGLLVYFGFFYYGGNFGCSVFFFCNDVSVDGVLSFFGGIVG